MKVVKDNLDHLVYQYKTACYESQETSQFVLCHVTYKAGQVPKRS